MVWHWTNWLLPQGHTIWPTESWLSTLLGHMCTLEHNSTLLQNRPIFSLILKKGGKVKIAFFSSKAQALLK